MNARFGGTPRAPHIVLAIAVTAPLVVAAGVSAQPPPVPPDLRRDEAVALALAHNPSLAAASGEIRAREAEVDQASRAPNPELSFDVENVAGSGSVRGLDAAEATLAVSQRLELGGKRAARLHAAERDRDLATGDHEVLRAEVAAGTAVAFSEVMAAQDRLALADTLVGVAEQVLAAVSRRVRAGGLSPVEERRARVSLETDRMDRERVARDLDAARHRLSAWWGSPEPSFVRADGRLDRLVDLPPLEALLSRLDDAPPLARWATEIERRRAEERMAAAAAIPDVALSAGVRYLADTDDAGLVLGLHVPLPLRDRNRGERRAAAERIRSAERERRADALRLGTELREAWTTLTGTRAEALALRDQVLPEAAAAFRDAADAHREGRLRFTEVLDTKRTLFELRGRFLDVLVLHHAAAARLERLLGAPLVAPDAEDS